MLEHRPPRYPLKSQAAKVLAPEKPSLPSGKRSQVVWPPLARMGPSAASETRLSLFVLPSRQFSRVRVGPRWHHAAELGAPPIGPFFSLLPQLKLQDGSLPPPLPAFRKGQLQKGRGATAQDSGPTQPRPQRLAGKGKMV